MTVIITAKRSNLHLAPEGITFEATVKGFDTPGPRGRKAYNPQLHEIHYIWDFGDPGEYTVPVNLVSEHRNANVAYGPIVSHVYRKAGTYTVTLEAVEPSSGKISKTTYKVVVGDPDRAFAGRETFFVDSGGDYRGAPAGSVGFSSLDAALNAARKGGPLKRIMLRRGQIFPTNSIRMRRDYGSLYFCASPGKGRKPQVMWKPGQHIQFFWINDVDAGKTKDFVFTNIRFQGPWNSTTETGTPRVSGIYTGEKRPSYILIDGCEFDGFSISISIVKSAAKNDMLILNDTVITNWQDYGIFEAQQGYTSVLGCRITQHVNALSGGPKDWSHNRHGCIRIQKGGKFVMDGCDLFSRNGWFENVKGWHTSQSCLRWNQLAVKGALANIQRCTGEGGWQVFAISTMKKSIVPNLQNAIVDKCLLIGGMMSSSVLRINYGGTTVRNCVMIHSDIRRDISPIYDPAAFIALEDLGTNRANTAGEIRIYNNTFVNLMQAGHYHSQENLPAAIFSNSGFTKSCAIIVAFPVLLKPLDSIVQS